MGHGRGRRGPGCDAGGRPGVDDRGSRRSVHAGVYVSSRRPDARPNPYRLSRREGRHACYQRDAGETYPLVVCLHGARGAGSDNRGRGIQAYGVLRAADVQAKHPSFLLVPQKPEGPQLWAGSHYSKGSYDLDKAPETPHLKSVHDLIAKIMKEHPIDPARVYVTGQSMGGYGTWDRLAVFTTPRSRRLTAVAAHQARSVPAILFSKSIRTGSMPMAKTACGRSRASSGTVSHLNPNSTSAACRRITLGRSSA